MTMSSKLSELDKTELSVLYLTLMGISAKIRKNLKAREKLLPLLKDYFNHKAADLTKHQKPEFAVSVIRMSFDFDKT